MRGNRRNRRRKEIVYNAKLIAVGVGMLMFSVKLQSYGSTPTMAEISEVRAETSYTEQKQIVMPTEEAEEQDFIFYQVPYGELPDDVQIYTHEICERYGLPTETVFAIMQRESKFDSGAVGDDGQSFGYMQVMKKWHVDRMEKLGVTDLQDPEANILVAVDYLSELYQKFGDMTSALMAYNCGPTKAKELLEDGIHQTGYTKEVMQYSEEIGTEIYGGAK